MLDSWLGSVRRTRVIPLMRLATWMARHLRVNSSSTTISFSTFPQCFLRVSKPAVMGKVPGIVYRSIAVHAIDSAGNCGNVASFDISVERPVKIFSDGFELPEPP